jgi:hypothetical protein
MGSSGRGGPSVAKRDGCPARRVQTRTPEVGTMLGHLLIAYAPVLGLAMVVMIGAWLRTKQKHAS